MSKRTSTPLAAICCFASLLVAGCFSVPGLNENAPETERQTTMEVHGPKVVVSFPITPLPDACMDIRFSFSSEFHSTAHFVSGTYLLEATGAGFTGLVSGIMDDGAAVTPAIRVTVGDAHAGWTGGRADNDAFASGAPYLEVCPSLDPDDLPEPTWTGQGYVVLLTDGTGAFDVSVRSPDVNWVVASDSDLLRYVLDDFDATAHATLGLSAAGTSYALDLEDPFGEQRTLAVFAPRPGVEHPGGAENPAGWEWVLEQPGGTRLETERIAFAASPGGGEWMFGIDGFGGGSEGERPVLWLTSW